jgi:uncharacterized integral membrane protein
MRYVKITFLLLFLTLLLIFVFENIDALSLPVSLRYDLALVVLGPLEIPLYALFFLAIFCGAISVAIIDIMVLFRQRRIMKKKDKQIKDMETELEKFRNLPLTEAVVPDVELTADKPDDTISVTQ